MILKAELCTEAAKTITRDADLHLAVGEGFLLLLRFSALFAAFETGDNVAILVHCLFRSVCIIGNRIHYNITISVTVWLII